MKILIVEDNLILSKNISKFLKIKKIENTVVHSAESAKLVLENEKYNLILLDVNLPHQNWVDFCWELRNNWNNIPIIFLTSRNAKQDLIIGLEAGWDDYLSKPFDYTELLLRINALYRRTTNIVSNIIVIDDIEINISKQEVIKNWIEIILTNIEFKLLEYFIQNRWKVLNRAEIYENVWGEFDKYQLSRNTDIYISHLRKKFWKEFIKTKKWTWYYID